MFIALLFHFGVIWALAPFYDVDTQIELDVPVMDMESYKEIWNTHRRPYIYSLTSNTRGKVLICGVSHSKDIDNPDLDSIKYYWKSFDPDVALVEGRVGNLITWLQNPVKELGEGGLITLLANKSGIDLFTWEPRRESEIKTLLKKYPAEELAMFYSFRPYFSNMRYGNYSDPESTLQGYLESRTNYPGIKGIFKTWQELEKKWKRNFPNVDWRDHGSGRGYPKGYLNDIWNDTNLLRDEHMIWSIIELVSGGKKVFVTMGVSHAPRIEKTLEAAFD